MEDGRSKMDGNGKGPRSMRGPLSCRLTLRSSIFDRCCYFVFATLLLWRAALFGWISPFRAARSSSLVAAFLASGVEPAALAFLTAVRNAARCARLRTAAARDLRMFFLAEAILGTKRSLDLGLICGRRSAGRHPAATTQTRPRNARARAWRVGG